MAFASIPYFISTPIELMIMDKAAAKAGGKAKDKPSFIPYLGKAAMMGRWVPLRYPIWLRPSTGWPSSRLPLW